MAREDTAGCLHSSIQGRRGGRQPQGLGAPVRRATSRATDPPRCGARGGTARLCVAPHTRPVGITGTSSGVRWCAWSHTTMHRRWRMLMRLGLAAPSMTAGAALLSLARGLNTRPDHTQGRGTCGRGEGRPAQAHREQVRAAAPAGLDPALGQAVINQRTWRASAAREAAAQCLMCGGGGGERGDWRAPTCWVWLSSAAPPQCANICGLVGTARPQRPCGGGAAASEHMVAAPRVAQLGIVPGSFDYGGRVGGGVQSARGAAIC